MDRLNAQLKAAESENETLKQSLQETKIAKAASETTFRVTAPSIEEVKAGKTTQLRDHSLIKSIALEVGRVLLS